MKEYVDVFPALQWIYMTRWQEEVRLRGDMYMILQKYKNKIFDSVYTNNPTLDYLKNKIKP